MELDDFRTGYSSLSYLRTIRFDALKIDRSFVASLGEEGSEGRAIVDTVTRMAQAMDMQIIAEGIESEEQFQVLAALGCHAGQGFLFGMPQEPEAIAKLLQEGGAVPATH
jgi:EAL domain-containing protein (putative c-di-GMP-specific phosphodiesterase class I)